MISDRWPERDLESVGCCPVCGRQGRSLLERGLCDRVFFVAPGQWTLWRCDGCASAYLDPRPTEASISRAYAEYYTHAVCPDECGLVNQRRSRLSAFRQGLRNGYLRRRFGHDLPHALTLGWMVMALLPGRRKNLDYMVRHLPASPAGARLLDVGCGNGRFLSVARALGYDTVGLEIDPKAARAARSAGHKIVEGTVAASGLPSETFDQITMNHVIEHLHRPREVLEALHRLLRPGGRIWIQTPNISSQGYQRYRAAWRGLEPPRHLVVFSPAGLNGLLSTAGFGHPTVLPPPAEAEFSFRRSAAIAEGRDPEAGPVERRPAWSRDARRADRRAARAPECAESVTIVACKGS